MPFFGLFFQGLWAGLTANAVNIAVATAIGGAAAAGASIGVFLTTTALGQLLLNVGVSALLARLTRRRQPSAEEARVNSRTGASLRWQAVGSVLVGGEAGAFGEHDDDGNFWFVVIHADNEMNDPAAARYFFDGIEVELSDGTDGFTAGDVLTDDFCLTTKGEQYEGEGTRLPIWRVYTVTTDATNAYGALPSAFTTAFPELPANWRLTGCAFTVIRGRSLQPQNYGKAYRWRGAFGLGEPAVTVYADFQRVYDPRDMAQDPDDQTTWEASGGNPALIWAWWRTHSLGRNKPMAEVNWTLVGEAADKCDETVLDRNGDSVPLYRCGLAFRDDLERWQCEQDILATMDGFTAYDDEGKAYPVPGFYAAPTLELTAARDLFTAQIDTTDDGEAPMDGVVCEYLSPDHNWQKVRSAPWYSDHYDGVSEPQLATISVHGCQSHNQAVRLAKAHGRRVQAARRGAFGATIKGILAKGQRGVLLDYDAQFQGAHQIVSPVEEDESGALTRLVVVPMASDDWTLNEDEEGEPPAVPPSLDIDNTLGLAAGVAVVSETVYLSGGVVGVRLLATFTAPTRPDRAYRFRYVPTAGGTHRYFVTDMDEDLARSELVDDGTEYRVSWQTVTAGGRATEWSDERDTPDFIDITATADDDPGVIASPSVTGGLGKVDWSGVSPVNLNVASVKLYRSAVGAGFGAATEIEEIAVGVGAAFSDYSGDNTRTNLWTNADFAGGATGWTLESEWSVGSGVATKVAGASIRRIYQAPSLTAGQVIRYAFEVTAITAGLFRLRITGSANADGANATVTGQQRGSVTVPTSPTSLGVMGNNVAAGSIDNLFAYVETGSCLSQGQYDWYLVAVSLAGTEGSPSSPITATVI